MIIEETKMRPVPGDGANQPSNCETEQINIPGSIQPFGVLLTVERESLQIQNISENCAAMWGIDARTLLGRSLRDLLSPPDLNALRHYLDTQNLEGHIPLTIRASFGQSSRSVPCEVKAHVHLGILFLEIEPGHIRETAQTEIFHRTLGSSLSALQRAQSLQELCEATVEQIKILTGFDRVMLYRFDTDWNGDVIAEAREKDVDSYLGLHFPASDIPSQARAVFLLNWLRMIPDVSYVPSRITPGSPSGSQEPLDLGKATLRSVSPVHLQYLKNMEVQASLTISLIDDGKLWGLIACHHGTPRLVNSDARLGAQLIGQLASSQLRVKEQLADQDYKLRLDRQSQRLVSLLETEGGFTEGLVKHSRELLGIAGAGAGAIYYRGEWSLIGKTPSVAVLESIVEWLSVHMPDDGVFHTNSISRHVPEAAAYNADASGLIAVQLTKAEKNYILWFRPEVATTVNWAGAPDKVVIKEGEQKILHPRLSFKSWQETVTGKAAPWKRVELDAVDTFRNRILSIALQVELKKEQAAREQAERLSLEKEEMVMMVSHDLRTPLSIIAMSLEFLQRVNPSQDPVIRRMIARGVSGAEAMETLIGEILDMSKIEGGSLNPTMCPVSGETLIRDIVELLLPLADEKGIYLRIDIKTQSSEVLCERNRVLQVLNNLMTNALKFTPTGGEIIVSLDAIGEERVFNVIDTGLGILPQELPKLFERFWQSDKTRAIGTGLGLWISKAIVESHGGRIWATSKIGTGSSVCFTLKSAE